MNFEWDPQKALANLQRHGVSFEEAATALRDPYSATARDPDHPIGEQRFVTFGFSALSRLLMVAYTDRGERIRIISAREATRSERKIYEEG